MKSRVSLVAFLALLFYSGSTFAIACRPISLPISVPVDSPWALITLILLISVVVYRFIRVSKN